MWDKPVVDIRTDVIKRGTLPAYLRLNETLGKPAQSRHTGEPLAYYVTEIGPLNRIIQLWSYEDLGEMERKRAALGNDADWEKYLRASKDVILDQRARVARRVSFPAIDAMSASVRDKPIVDLRTYAIQRTRMNEFLSTTEKYCLPVMLRHIGPPLAYYVSQIGELDQVTHLWGYDSLADFERRRAARNSDAEWPAYLQASDGLFVNQETCVIRRLRLGRASP